MEEGGPSCGWAAVNCADTKGRSARMERRRGLAGRRLLHGRLNNANTGRRQIDRVPHHEPQTKKEGAMATSSPAPRKKMLVVDDDASVHDFVGHVLRSQPVDIACCVTAAEGLRRISEGSFDLVLLDLGLPDMHGLEVLARLRQMGRNFRVIVITADETPESLLRAIRQNTYDYLRKPFSATELARAGDAGAEGEGRSGDRSGVGKAGVAGVVDPVHARCRRTD